MTNIREHFPEELLCICCSQVIPADHPDEQFCRTCWAFGCVSA